MWVRRASDNATRAVAIRRARLCVRALLVRVDKHFYRRNRAIDAAAPALSAPADIRQTCRLIKASQDMSQAAFQKQADWR
jgi:hypothetical protein